MLIKLLEYFCNLFNLTFPSVFTYASTKMMLSAITSLIITIFLGPFVIKKLYFLKINQTIRGKDICPHLYSLHEKKKDTPTMGGVLILFSMLISLFLWMDIKSTFTLILLITTLFLGLIGGIDDFLKLKYKHSKGMPSKVKFLLQLIFAFFIAFFLVVPNNSIKTKKLKLSSNKVSIQEIIKDKDNFAQKNKSSSKNLTTKEYMSKIYIPFFKTPINLKGPLIIFSFLLIVFVIVGSSNAVNLTDGLDGLASGCLIMVAISFGIISFLSNNVYMAKYLNILYLEGVEDIGIYLFATAGALLGFLWYNGYPAQIFMGDTGSLALGGIIGVSAILLRREVLLAIIGGVFVIEAISVILQVLSYRYRNKKRIFLCAPLHHHFEYKKMHETKVVLRFWIISLLLAIIGIASIKFQ
jgi:phospho-N-acetylmuramoyl-pentapeptide-transferase